MQDRLFLPDRLVIDSRSEELPAELLLVVKRVVHQAMLEAGHFGHELLQLLFAFVCLVDIGPGLLCDVGYLVWAHADNLVLRSGSDGYGGLAVDQ